MNDTLDDVIASAAQVSPRWRDALTAAALLAVDPAGAGGMLLRAQPGPARDRLLMSLRDLLPAQTPWRRIPVHVTDGRLLGGLDLAATLQAGRPIAERGLLAEADGGVVVLAMAERVAPGAAARLTAVLDRGEVQLERDGLGTRLAARFGVIALDESAGDDERVTPALVDRLGLIIDLHGIALRDLDSVALPWDAAAIAAARARLAVVRGTPPADAIVEALVGTAAALGIDSLRAPLFALRIAQAHAALDGRDELGEDDLRLAARLVLGPRATVIPNLEDDEPPPEEPPPPEGEQQQNEDEQNTPDQPLEDVVLEAAAAAIPPGLLALLLAGGSTRSRGQSGGRAGQAQKTKLRGRPTGTRRGEPRGGLRLNVVETLRAAAPWQPLRRRTAKVARRVEVRRDDFRVTHFKQPSLTTTIFVVDASGSSALHRLAEVKGAVELLLADCYVRRDRVALIAFRGQGAELVLPPTRSLVRAKRTLAGLPGGGATPLAAGLDAATQLADAVKRRGETAVVVVMTDGRANVGRDPAAGRAGAEADAVTAAQALRVLGVKALLIDTSPRPAPAAQKIAEALGGPYVPLPQADAQSVSRAVQLATR